ncbi:MAG TPA: cyclase family protein [Acidimicrobiales bacterium]|nr:cyclase family protein [Acidimicrobiales bacterium]
MALPPRLKALAARVANTGRWGDDDERGTLNLLTAEAVLRGVRAVRQGKVFSLAIPFDEDGPQTGAIPGRDNPVRRMLTVNSAFTGDPSDFCTSDDTVTMGVQASTHWDALAHVSYEGRLYNGIPAASVDESGAGRLGIDRFGPVVGRGILADVARVHGVDHFDEAYPITGDDLDAAVDKAGVRVEPGDVLLVRTGQMHWLREGDRRRFGHPAPGLSTQSVEWLRDHDVAAVATDTLALEVFPGEDPAVLLPVHMLHLVDMGLAQGQLWSLDALAADCATDGQYDFLLCATPLPLTRAVGGPVAPTAVK